MGRLQDKVAIVTGGAKGIGLHYVRALAAEGARVVAADIQGDAESFDEMAAVDFRHLDVSSEDSVRSLVDGTVARHGRLDIIVNNAALFADLALADPMEIDVQLWDRVMAVNVRGPFLMAKHAARHMIRAGYGKIINIGSGLAYKGAVGFAHYATSKGAVVAMTRALSRDLGAFGIRVNTLCPGLTLSDSILANEEHIGRFRDASVAGRALRRDAYPEDLIGALIFLASPDSDFMTGQSLAVDGGSVNL